jgi:peptide/nickel transport system substrate-binding protein
MSWMKFSRFIGIGIFLICGSINLAIAEELAKEQVVVYGNPAGDIGTIDPQGGQLTQDQFHRPNLFDALVHYPIGDANSPNFEPALATKWEVKPDKLTWVFHLRKGVKWSHGFGEFTADDVVYSYNRAKNGKASAFRGDFANFKDVKAIDKYTVQITTHTTDPYMLLKVSNCLSGFIKGGPKL